MKLTLCALAAVAISLCHSLTKENTQTEALTPAGQQEATTPDTIVTLSNFTGSSRSFSMVSSPPTNKTCQLYISTDQQTWKKFGVPFASTGNLKIIPLHEISEDALYVRLHAR